MSKVYTGLDVHKEIHKTWQQKMLISLYSRFSRRTPILKISFLFDTAQRGFDSPGVQATPENLQRGRTLVPRPVSRIVNANATDSRDSLAFSLVKVFSHESSIRTRKCDECGVRKEKL